MLAALLVLGPESSKAAADLAVGECAEGITKESSSSDSAMLGWTQTPLACLEVLGRSMVERTVGYFQQSGVEEICILADRSMAHAQLDVEHTANGISVTWVANAWGAITQKLTSFRDTGVETAFVVGMDAYAEFDPLPALQFHRERKHVLTRAVGADGPLNIWIADVARMADEIASQDEQDENDAFSHAGTDAAYTVPGYINRLQSAKDLRRLVTDALHSRCNFHPIGQEVRPGIWLGDGAQIHRGARIVSPAFVGRNSKVGDDCLVTRCSNIENDCEIDYGTAVEDSSVLSNSYVGIGLDIAHSIVNGRNLLNLKRDKALEIADPAVIRQNISLPKRKVHGSSAESFGLEGMLFEPAE